MTLLKSERETVQTVYFAYYSVSAPPPPSPQNLKLLGLILYFILIMPLNDRIVKYVYNPVESL